ncbi:hypothetical protein AK830_g3907 [Neonectria ditissima]|uniref:Uncharacterized protein n=1 Tax=Neonectria ditissima TaxID=78410 RepID=A0A0P7BH15_9HYPO|nr:hypothetical protein AK830_g3907 [Neonectria ditissima]
MHNPERERQGSVPYSTSGSDVFLGARSAETGNAFGPPLPSTGFESIDLHGDRSAPRASIEPLEPLEFTEPMDLDTSSSDSASSSDSNELPELTRCPTRNSPGSSTPRRTKYVEVFDEPEVEHVEVVDRKICASPPQVLQASPPHGAPRRIRIQLHGRGRGYRYTGADLPTNWPPFDEFCVLPVRPKNPAWDKMLGGEVRWNEDVDDVFLGLVRKEGGHDGQPNSRLVTDYKEPAEEIANPHNQTEEPLSDYEEFTHLGTIDPFYSLESDENCTISKTEEAASRWEKRRTHRSDPPPSLQSTSSTPNRDRNTPNKDSDGFQWTRPWKREVIREYGIWLCSRCERFLDRETPDPKDEAEVQDAHSLFEMWPPFARKVQEPLRRRKCAYCELENFCHMFESFSMNRWAIEDEMATWKRQPLS